MARPTKRKDGIPMTGAEREAKRYARKRKSINRKRRTLRKLAKQGNEAELRREASRNAPPLPDGATLLIGDCRELLATQPDNSVALILTDPPYAREAEPLYWAIAENAPRLLIDGGSLVCYGGNLTEARDQRIFDQYLTRQPQCIMPLSPAQPLFGPKVFAKHRPIHWYTKGPRRGASMMPTVFVSAGKDKIAHPWAQGDGGVWVPIEHLTNPGELILDPCAGTARWGRIATAMGRRWMGFDIAEGGTTTIAVAT
jgi:hypothetical protein